MSKCTCEALSVKTRELQGIYPCFCKTCNLTCIITKPAKYAHFGHKAYTFAAKHANVPNHTQTCQNASKTCTKHVKACTIDTKHASHTYLLQTMQKCTITTKHAKMQQSIYICYKTYQNMYFWYKITQHMSKCNKTACLLQHTHILTCFAQNISKCSKTACLGYKHVKLHMRCFQNCTF